jgi:hypothetical protein
LKSFEIHLETLVEAVATANLPSEIVHVLATLFPVVFTLLRE